MALDKPYMDIPGTTIFDADMSRIGFHLNQFCMSLMKAENRDAFKADERGYLDRYPMTEDQKLAVLARDYNRMIALGGNVYFLAKIFSTDGQSFELAASRMTGVTQPEYRQMMINGGRPPDGNRYIHEWEASGKLPPRAMPGADTRARPTAGGDQGGEKAMTPAVAHSTVTEATNKDGGKR
jgi:protocatechuate 4,5-dioxygenase alpha chain